ncbi:hypothetical protein G647_10295 [Cladophialophora carrionii CBS 160.54]|uniref:JmjC domain-containing protein n=1 Tax=Cladophialophora carrionii CBS 160.54 TaxID=1279043 RepID=V9DIW2_9EURO|nr:uncharacterized protein G647_10295 [Cladophialophora carrionii CBS 160.54]ETI26849.1 hypothetical protein G647_10295 [Cladophialophora carrionii CBS 160.54]
MCNRIFPSQDFARREDKQAPEDLLPTRAGAVPPNKPVCPHDGLNDLSSPEPAVPAPLNAATPPDSITDPEAAAPLERDASNPPDGSPGPEVEAPLERDAANPRGSAPCPLGKGCANSLPERSVRPGFGARRRSVYAPQIAGLLAEMTEVADEVELDSSDGHRVSNGDNATDSDGIRWRHLADKYRDITSVTAPDAFASCWVPANSTLGPGDVEDVADAEMIVMTWTEFLDSRDLIAERQVPVLLSEVPGVPPNLTVPSLIERLEFMERGATICIQEFSQSFPSAPVVSEVVAQFRQVIQQSRLGRAYPPMNMLSIRGHLVPYAVPPPFEEMRYQVLPYMAEQLRLEAHSKARGHRADVGKQPFEIKIGSRSIDLQECFSFVLLASRGSYSNVHVDVINGTWVSCLCGIKVWSFVPFPTDAEKAAFQEQGAHWKPEPGRLKHVVLLAGEMLIMPAGSLTIHAPLTLEDCLMKGGMYMDAHRIIQFMDHLIWIARHPHVTNEPVQRELAKAWPHLEDIARRNPEYFGEDFDLEAFNMKSQEVKIYLGCREPCLGRRNPRCSATACSCRCVQSHKPSCRCLSSNIQQYGDDATGECLAFCAQPKSPKGNKEANPRNRSSRPSDEDSPRVP